MTEYNYNNRNGINNLKVNWGKVAKVAATLGVTLMLAVGASKVLPLKVEYDPSRRYMTIEQPVSPNDPDLIREYNVNRLNKLLEQGVQYNGGLHQLLSSKYFDQKEALSEFESKTLYDCNLLYSHHLEELQKVDTTKFSPFKYYYLSERWYGNALTEEQQKELNYLNSIKEAYDYKILTSYGIDSFNPARFGWLRLLKYSKTILDADAEDLYRMEVVRPYYDEKRTAELGFNSETVFTYQNRETRSILLDKYVRTDLKKPSSYNGEDYVKIYDLDLKDKYYTNHVLYSHDRSK